MNRKRISVPPLDSQLRRNYKERPPNTGVNTDGNAGGLTVPGAASVFTPVLGGRPSNSDRCD